MDVEVAYDDAAWSFEAWWWWQVIRAAGEVTVFAIFFFSIFIIEFLHVFLLI